MLSIRKVLFAMILVGSVTDATLNSARFPQASAPPAEVNEYSQASHVAAVQIEGRNDEGQLLFSSERGPYANEQSAERHSANGLATSSQPPYPDAGESTVPQATAVQIGIHTRSGSGLTEATYEPVGNPSFEEAEVVEVSSESNTSSRMDGSRKRSRIVDVPKAKRSKVAVKKYRAKHHGKKKHESFPWVLSLAVIAAIIYFFFM